MAAQASEFDADRKQGTVVNRTNDYGEIRKEKFLEQAYRHPLPVQEGHQHHAPELCKLNRYCMDLAEYWKDLGLELGLSDNIITNIDLDYKRTKDKCYHMFREWLKRSKDPCSCHVVKALRKCDMNQVAKKIEDAFLNYAFNRPVLPHLYEEHSTRTCNLEEIDVLQLENLRSTQYIVYSQPVASENYTRREILIYTGCSPPIAAQNHENSECTTKQKTFKLESDLQRLPEEHDYFFPVAKQQHVPSNKRGIQQKYVLSRTQERHEPRIQTIKEDFHHDSRKQNMGKQHKPVVDENLYCTTPTVQAVDSSIQTMQAVDSSIQTMQAVEQHCELQVHCQTTADRLLHHNSEPAIKQPCKSSCTPAMEEEEYGSLQTMAHYCEPITEQVEHHQYECNLIHCQAKENLEPTTRLQTVEKKLHSNTSMQAVNEQCKPSSTLVMKQGNYLMSMRTMEHQSQHYTTKQMEQSLVLNSIPVTQQQSEGYRSQTMDWQCDSMQNTLQQIEPSVQEVNQQYDHSITHYEAMKRQFKSSSTQISKQKVDSKRVKQQHGLGVDQALTQNSVQISKHQIDHTRMQETEQLNELKYSPLQKGHPPADTISENSLVTLRQRSAELKLKEDCYPCCRQSADPQNLHRGLSQNGASAISHDKKLTIFQDKSVLIYLIHIFGVCILLYLAVIVSLLSALFIIGILLWH